MRTKLCDLLGIEHPIVQAGMGSFTSPELVASEPKRRIGIYELRILDQPPTY